MARWFYDSAGEPVLHQSGDYLYDATTNKPRYRIEGEHVYDIATDMLAFHLSGTSLNNPDGTRAFYYVKKE
jgi:hypothetical protein